ncbi:MAG TPA: EAL domain-containing protein [Anaerolineaceae bacterium]|nr:EAL domain-containing protein [Anaerolineaceae bacterium]
MNTIISKFKITYMTILHLLIVGIFPIMIISILITWFYDNQLLSKILIIISLVFFLLVLLFTLLLNKYLITPIKVVAKNISEISSDEISPPTEIDESPYQGEVKELLSSYNIFVQNQNQKIEKEKILLEQSKRIDTAIHGSKIGIWDWNLQTNECYFSSTWRNILGHTQESIHNLSTEWFTRVHPEDIDELQKAINDSISEGKSTFHHEYRIRHFNDNYIWVLTRGVVKKDIENIATRFVGIMANITAQKNLETRLSAEAMYDSFTGLPNKIYFSGIIDQSLGRIRRRDNYHSAVLYIDLDRFKNVNDNFSYEFGDELLLEITRRLKYSLRTMDTIARFNHDKFGVLLEEINGLPDAIKITTRLHSEITQPFTFSGKQTDIDASIGLVLITRGYQNSNEVLRDAESSLIQAKVNGRGKFEIFDKESYSFQLSKIRIEKEIKHALANEEFHVHYEPIISTKSNQIIQAEAHLIWQHPERGLIPSQHYKKIAEDFDGVNAYNKFILRKACQDAWDWSVNDFPNVKICVNISTKMLLEPDFPETILAILADNQLPNSSLQLVISESSLIYNSGITIQNMFNLYSIGVTFSLADYGVTPSSLEQLKRIPIQSIRISESILKDLPQNTEDASITRAIIAIGNILDIEIVATGVETQDQADFLMGEGVHFLGGKFLSQPLEKPEFINYLKKVEQK